MRELGRQAPGAVPFLAVATTNVDVRLFQQASESTMTRFPMLTGDQIKEQNFARTIQMANRRGKGSAIIKGNGL